MTAPSPNEATVGRPALEPVEADPLRGGEAAIEARNFSFWYGKSQALYDVSIAFRTGR